MELIDALVIRNGGWRSQLERDLYDHAGDVLSAYVKKLRLEYTIKVSKEELDLINGHRGNYPGP